MRKKVLLLVDDTPANLRLADAMLGDTYDIRTATSGKMALEMMKIVVPDLVLLDVMMPGMNGYEVCNALKADPATRDTPVIFLTGQTEVTEEQRGFEAGAVDYIQKPFSEAIIRARIETHLTLKDAREQLALQLAILKADLETARNVQLSILPQEIPRMDGLEIAARYVPMKALGGDFYDFIVVDEKRIGVLIADVSGHGTSAALIASMLKVSLAEQTDYAAEPSKILSRLNQTLFGKFRHHHVTAAYVFLDMEKKILKYAGAAHPALLFREAAGGNVREVLENGLMLSSFREASYHQVELPVAAGDWLLLLTDGVSEAKNPSEEYFGAGALQRIFKEHHATSADQFTAQLLDEFYRWTAAPGGSELEDDVTFLALHVHG